MSVAPASPIVVELLPPTLEKKKVMTDTPAPAPAVKKMPKEKTCCSAFMQSVRTFIICQILASIFLLIIGCLLVSPIGDDAYYTPLNIKHPYGQLPTWGVQELYHDAQSHHAIFSQHKDRIVDWSAPSNELFTKITDRFVHLLEVWLPSRLVPAPTHILHLLQGPAKLQVLRSILLLGIPELLADKVMSLSDLHDAIRTSQHQKAQEATLKAGMMPTTKEDGSFTMPDFSQLPLAKLERLMSFALSFGFFQEVSYAGSHIYVHNALSVVMRKDHPNNQNALLLVNSNEFYLVWHNLLSGLLTPDDSSSIDDVFLDSYSASVLDIQAGTDSMEVLTTRRAKYVGSKTLTQEKREQHEKKRHELMEKRVERLQQVVKDAPESAVPSSSDSLLTSKAWSSTHQTSSMQAFYKQYPALEKNYVQARNAVEKMGNMALVQDFAWGVMESHSSTSTSNSLSTPIDTLIDLGGSLSSFFVEVMLSNPSVQHAVLFVDSQEEIEQAKKQFSKHEISKKTSFLAGNFFTTPSSLPTPSSTGATRYILRSFLHSWSDLETTLMLKNLRTVVGKRKDVSLVIVEMNLPVTRIDSLAHVRRWNDVAQMICCNSEERSQTKWEVLFQASGWRLVQGGVQQTRSGEQVMELRPSEENGEVKGVKERQKSATATVDHQEL